MLFRIIYHFPPRPVESWWDRRICCLEASKFDTVNHLAHQKIHKWCILGTLSPLMAQGLEKSPFPSLNSWSTCISFSHHILCSLILLKHSESINAPKNYTNDALWGRHAPRPRMIWGMENIFPSLCQWAHLPAPVSATVFRHSLVLKNNIVTDHVRFWYVCSCYS